MKKNLFLTLLIAFALIIFVACDDDDDDDKPPVEQDVTTDADADAPESETDPKPDADEVGVCEEIESTTIDPKEGWTSYAGMRFVGTINDGNSSAQPTNAFVSKAVVKFPNHPNFSMGGQGMAYASNGMQDINGDGTQDEILNAVVFGNIKQAGTSVTADGLIVMLPTDVMRQLKNEKVCAIEEPTTIQALSLEQNNSGFSKQCIVGVIYMEQNEDGTYLVDGNFAINHNENETFAIGEVLDISVRSAMIDDPAKLVELFTDVETEEDLCACFQDQSQIECPTTEEPTDEDTTDEDTTDEETDTETTDEEPAFDLSCYNAACTTAADCACVGAEVDCPAGGPMAGKCQIVACNEEGAPGCPDGKTCTDYSAFLPEGTSYTHLCN